jgi:hypothetical protein
MKPRIFIVLASACVALVSCEKEDDDTTVTPPPVAASTGTLMGRVELGDENDAPIADRSGVGVTLDGTSFSTTTGADGVWHVDSVPAGVYDIALRKPGFTRDYVFGYQFVGSDTGYVWPQVSRTDGFTQLRRIPYAISTLSASADTVVRVRGTLAPRGYGHILLLAGSSSDVSPLDGTYRMFDVLSQSDTTPLAVSYSAAYLHFHGFAAGSRMYIVAYPCRSGAQAYNPRNGRRYFTEVGDSSSQVVDVIVP